MLALRNIPGQGRTFRFFGRCLFYFFCFSFFFSLGRFRLLEMLQSVGALVAREPTSCAHRWGQAGGCWARSRCRAHPPKALPEAAWRRCMHRPLPAAVPAESGPVPAARRWPARPSTGGERLWRVAVRRRAGTSRALATANLRRNATTSAPNSPPTSMPTTTNLHRQANGQSLPTTMRVCAELAQSLGGFAV